MEWLKKSPSPQSAWGGFTPPKVRDRNQFNLFDTGGLLKPAGPFSCRWNAPQQAQGWTPGKGAPQGDNLFGGGGSSPRVKGFLQMLFGK